MIQSKINIRVATPKDYDEIYSLVNTAFRNTEFVGRSADYVLYIRNGSNYMPDMEYIIEKDNQIIGYLLLSKQLIYTDNKIHEAVIAAPLCIALPYRGFGLGKKLVDFACENARKKGYSILFAIGNDEFYGKYGFKSINNYNIKNISSVPDEILMGIELSHNSLESINGKIDVY